MVGELPEEPVPNAAAIVHVHRRRDEQVQDDELRREQCGKHVAMTGDALERDGSTRAADATQGRRLSLIAWLRGRRQTADILNVAPQGRPEFAPDASRPS